MMRGRGPVRNVAPVNVGEEVDVKVEALGEKGDGIAKVKGFVLFVPNVNQGDEIRVKITKVLRSVGFAESIGPASGPIESDSYQKEESQEEIETPENDSSDDVDDEEVSQEDTEDFGEEDR